MLMRAAAFCRWRRRDAAAATDAHRHLLIMPALFARAAPPDMSRRVHFAARVSADEACCRRRADAAQPPAADDAMFRMRFAMRIFDTSFAAPTRAKMRLRAMLSLLS